MLDRPEGDAAWIMDMATEWCLTQRLMGKMIELHASCKESRVCVCVYN